MAFDFNFLNNIAIIADDGTKISYRQIQAFSEEIYKIVRQRCLIFCLCQNSPGSLIGYISFISSKVVPVMLDANIDDTALRMLITLYNPQFIWLPDCRLYDFHPFGKVFSQYKYSLIRMDYLNFPLHKDLAMLLTTSGSTGSSKFVRISYENIEANATSIASYLSITEKERPVTTLPMFYSYGLSVINSHILNGATILLTSKTLVEKEFWNFLKEQEATSISGIPYTYKILDKLQFPRMGLSSLKTLTQAGGRLDDSLRRKFSEYCTESGKQFFVMYGQTEATARMSYVPPQYAQTKSGSIGIPIPGGEFSLVDEMGIEIYEHGTTGELVYRGKNVSMGYANCKDDLNKGDENNGTLFTGDLARRDRNNFYYIAGRKSRFIKLFGNRISLDETESLLENIVPDCACTGEDDLMIVHITDKNRIAEIQSYLSVKTGINPAAFSVRHCDDIPTNPAGKIIYSALEIS